MVIRGVLIKHGSWIKKEREKQLTLLLNKIHVVEFQHKHAPTTLLELELLSLLRQIVDLLQYKIKATLQFYCKIGYESGDKCGKTLARSIRDHKLTIPQTMSSKGHKAVLPKQIAQKFRDFY